MESISIFDLSIGILLIIFGIKGLFNGFIKEVFGLVGIIGGIFIASRFANGAGNFIDDSIYHISNRASVYFIGFISVLVLFWMTSLFIGFIFTKLVSLSGLGLVNRILGFIVGSIKIFLLFSIVIFALRTVDIFRNNIDKKLDGSYTYPYLIKTGNYIVKFNFNDANKTISNIIESNNTKKNK
jgi:membrane protein required for colicin V production